MNANIPESRRVFHLPANHRRRTRISDLRERRSREPKRRRRVATLHPREVFLLRLATAEVSEEWEIDRTRNLVGET
jgi:hypothetical protein